MGNLKEALTALFNSNNYTPSTSGITNKKIPVTETSGLPSGQMSIPNLVAVMGAPSVAGYVYSANTVNSDDDLNDLTEMGCYRCKAASVSRTVTNRPSDSSDLYGFSVINIQPYNGTAFETQIFVQLSNIWVRNVTTMAAPHTWTEWKKVAFVTE